MGKEEERENRGKTERNLVPGDLILAVEALTKMFQDWREKAVSEMTKRWTIGTNIITV